MARARHLTLMVLVAFMVFFSLNYILSSNQSDTPPTPAPVTDENPDFPSLGGLSDNVLHGGSIAPKLENATAKAELGRATWKFLHTMMARYPENPTEDDQIALKTFIHLFGRLYPCGQCAEHFREMLKTLPPQTSSRNAAAGWACYVHNIVNKKVHKPEFDCSKIGDFYDCGCGDDKKEGTEAEGSSGGGGGGTEDSNVELNRAG